MCCPDCCDDDGWGECAIECKCYCHDDDGSGDDPDDDPCIGAECCNPSFDHSSSECVTAEQMAAYAADATAPDGEAPWSRSKRDNGFPSAVMISWRKRRDNIVTAIDHESIDEREATDALLSLVDDMIEALQRATVIGSSNGEESADSTH